MPIDDVLENMKLADFCFPLKNALVYFMDSIYFDIEKEISEENIQKMIQFIFIIANDLERFIEIQAKLKQSKNSQNKQTKLRGDAEMDEENID